MRILLLSQFFWPEMRTAPTNLAAMAADLSEKGHDVRVITGFPNHPLGRIYDGYHQKLWQRDQYKKASILRLPLYPDHSKAFSRRMLSFTSFALSSSVLGPILSRGFKPDVIFAYFAPLTIGPVAKWYSMLFGVPLVYWITDLWPENLLATEAKIPEKVFKVLRMMEDWSYAQASRICVDSPGFRTNLLEKGVADEKIEVVTEWAEEDLFYPVPYDESLADEYELRGKFNIIYGGNFGTVQGLDTVVRAAEQLLDLTDVQFVFIGDGNEEAQLKDLALSLALPNVRFIPRQPMEEIHKFFALAEVLLVHLKDKPIFHLQLPSKVLAYMACGRPILCAISGSAEQIVLDGGAGLSCPSEDPDSIAQLVRQFYTMDETQREAMGASARQSYLQKHTRSVQVARIESILQSVANSSTIFQ